MTSSTSTSTSTPRSSFDKAVTTRDHFLEELAKEVTKPKEQIVSLDLSSTGSHLEKGGIPSGFQDDVLPKKNNGKSVRFLRHQVFSLYRKLFSVVFLANLAVFVWLLVRGTNAQQVAGITIVNLFVSILHRQDYVINAYFWLFTRVPLS